MEFEELAEIVRSQAHIPMFHDYLKDNTQCFFICFTRNFISKLKDGNDRPSGELVLHHTNYQPVLTDVSQTVCQMPGCEWYGTKKKPSACGVHFIGSTRQPHLTKM